MMISIETYHARISSFVIKYEEEDVGRQIWFLGLVIYGIEINPCLPVEQGKIDQILVLVRNEEKENKVIKSLLETYNQECTKIKNGLGPIFEKLNKVMNKVISVYRQISQ
jgi:hypothetical protein